MVSDGPHGLRKPVATSMLDAAGSEPATCFPTASSLGSTWDRDLAAAVGRAIAAEARVAGVSVVLGPGVNIKRHPLCGRNFEYLSEDPLLAGVLAAAFIHGAQSQGVGTSIKHFAVNNQEANRMVVDAIVDERTLREIYLPAFEIAVKEAAPWTVMCAYNRLNGTYCAEHTWLLTEVLRDDWGFQGLVVTDWGANDDRVAGVLAGQDLEMPGGGSVHDAVVVDAVRGGSLAEAAVDRCARRVVNLLEQAAAATDVPTPPLDLDANHALARRVAAAGTVLCTNDGLLPLDASSHIALVGEFAVRPRYQGSGSSQVNPSRRDTMLDEMRRVVGDRGGRLRYARGYDARARDGDAVDAGLIDEAVAVSARADAAVVVVGLPPSWETEGVDRAHMRLPHQHNELVRAVCAANPRTVVVLCNGAPVMMPWVDLPAAVVEAHLGGQAGAGGVVDVLTGEAEPGGRLAETYPLRQADVAADRWFPGDPRQVQYREGLFVGYRWFDAAGLDVLFPFGHGLSYTTWSVEEVAVSPPSRMRVPWSR